MKFDFINSTYYKSFVKGEGEAIISQILQDPEMIRANFMAWANWFTVDPYTTPTDSTGVAAFKAQMKELQTAKVMSMRAPLGDSTPEDKKGIAFYTGTIPDFITYGTVETAAERAYKEKMFEANFGNDAFIVSQFVDNIQTKIDSANQTLTNMAAQMMSKGSIKWIYGVGATNMPVLKADIPEANFSKAGSKVWNAGDCKLLDQMVAIQDKYKDLWGVEMPMQWDIPYDMFHNVFLKNAQVIELVRYAKSINNVLLPEITTVTEDMFNEAVRLRPELFPISIVSEKQRDVTGVVNGWKANVAVLRPLGYAGTVKRTDILDREMYDKYGASDITRVFASSANGLYTIMNTTLNNGNLKEWHTDLMMSAVPVLEEFLYHVIVDTQTADE